MTHQEKIIKLQKEMTRFGLLCVGGYTATVVLAVVAIWYFEIATFAEKCGC